MKKYLGLFICLGLLGCKNQQLFKTENTVQISIKDYGEDVKIPSDVWNLIEEKDIKESEKLSVEGSGGKDTTGHGEAVPTHGAAPAHGEAPAAAEASGHGGGAEGGTVSASLTEVGTNFVFAPIKVYLTEKNKGVLREPSVEILFPRGGGEVDLSQYTTGQVGTFYVAFEMEGTDGAAISTVHYVSQARQRIVDGKKLGAGCNIFMDIKEYLLKSQETTGIEVNTNRNRHLSVLGGTFVFSAKGEHDISVAQVNFVDHKQPQYFCDFVEKNKQDNLKKSADDDLELPQ